jgi:hypothetical protein
MSLGAAAILGGSMLGASALSDDGGGGEMREASRLTPGQRDLLDTLTTLLGGQVGIGTTPYPGQRVAPTSGLQQQAFDLMSGFMPMAQTGQNIMQQALQGFSPGAAQGFQQMGGDALGNLMKPFDPTEATQFWEAAHVTPALKMWQQDIIPTIKEHYAARDAADSGAMDRALARSGETLTTNLSAQLANLLFQGQQSQKGMQLQAIPETYRMGMMGGDVLNQILSGAGQLPLNIISQALGVGGVERGIGGEQLMGEQQAWGEGQPYANPWLQLLGPALGTQAVEPYYKESGPGMAAMLLPLLGQAMGSEGFWNMINPAGSQVGTPTASYMGGGMSYTPGMGLPQGMSLSNLTPFTNAWLGGFQGDR